MLLQHFYWSLHQRADALVLRHSHRPLLPTMGAANDSAHQHPQAGKVLEAAAFPDADLINQSQGVSAYPHLWCAMTQQQAISWLVVELQAG